MTMVKLFGFDNDLEDLMISEVLSNIDFAPLDEADYAKLNRWFNKRISSYNTKLIEHRNSGISKSDVFVNEISYLDYEDIKQAVDNLKISGTGYGLIAFAESLDNKTRKASIWIAYINERDGKIIHAIRYKELCDNPFGAAGALFIWQSAIEANLKNAGYDLKMAKKF